MLSNFCKDMRPIAATLLLLFTAISNGNTKPASAADAKLIEGAKKERELVWYTSMSIDHATQMKEAFNKEYPFLRVDVYRASTEKVTNKILTEARANKYPDVVILPGMEARILYNSGLFTPYMSPEGKFIPEGFKDPQGYWHEVFKHMMVIAHNTRMVSRQEAPRTYEDLLNPKWKGRMVMDAEEPEWVANVIQYMGKEKGIKFMERLAGQNLQFRDGHTMVAMLTAAGEFDICVGCYNYRIEDLKSKGAPIEWVGADPVFSLLHPVAIFSKAAHPNAAKLFVDFVLSKDGGQKVIQRVKRIPARPDVEPDPPRLTKGLRFIPMDPKMGDRYNEIIKQFYDLFPAAKGAM